MGGVTEFFGGLVKGYSELFATLPEEYFALVNVFIFAVLISLYAVFTWKFYRLLSKRDIISLNLSQYNRVEHPLLKKLIATFLYMMEYIIILPALIFFWFGVLALIILVLSESLDIGQVIIVSAAMVASIRILAYYEEGLSKDMAKMFPFTILAIFLLSPEFFSLERISNNLTLIPNLFSKIIYFLALIIAIEFLLRILDLGMRFMFSNRNSLEE
jgi:hypothetical protein